MQHVKHITATFSVSPQIAPGHLAQLKAAGFSVVVCNRPDHEEPGQPAFAEIRAAAEAVGLEAHHIPVQPGQATEQDIRAFDAVLTNAGGKVLGYCRSGGRSQSLHSATGR